MRENLARGNRTLDLSFRTSKRLHRPLVVGVISTEPGLASLAHNGRLQCDIVELRLDYLMRSETPLSVIEECLTSSQHKFLLTLRHQYEGGVYSWEPKERVSILKTFIRYASVVDIELAFASQFLPLVRSRYKKKILLSAHFFEQTPDDAKLADLLEKMWMRRPNFLKVACLCNSTADLGRLVVMQYLNRHLPLALMGMGDLAPLSRTILPLVGARIVYGYLDEPTAPGQPSVKEVMKFCINSNLRR